MIDDRKVNMVFCEFMKESQFMTPIPKSDAMLCACMSERVFELMQQEVGIGEGLRRDAKEILHFRALS